MKMSPGFMILQKTGLSSRFHRKKVPRNLPKSRSIVVVVVVVVQGVQKKMRRSFCLISLAANMLEGWDIIHWKGGIHSFVWSTKTFLCDIWEPRYKQNKIGYQISKCLNIGQS